MFLSVDPKSSSPSGENATLFVNVEPLHVGVFSVCSSSPSSVRHSRTSLTFDEANSSPSGENATLSTDHGEGGFRMRSTAPSSIPHSQIDVLPAKAIPPPE